MRSKPRSSRPQRSHCLIIVHTHERIKRTLIALDAQSSPPDTITVSADTDDERIIQEVSLAVETTKQPVYLVLRARCSSSRRAQNRNNAVRCLLDTHTPAPEDALIFLDGDCIPDPAVCQAHLDTLQRADVSLGYAIRLDDQQTQGLTDHPGLAFQLKHLLNSEQRQEPALHHRKARKNILLRRLGLTKPHKPSILSGNFALQLLNFQAINGFNEAFEGWGAEDDDIARRLYRTGARPGSSMKTAVVYHQFHQSEAKPNWEENPNSASLSQQFATYASLGLKNPAKQPMPRKLAISPKHHMSAERKSKYQSTPSSQCPSSPKPIQ